MMAELKRKEDELTTADLAGGAGAQKEAARETPEAAGPRLIGERAGEIAGKMGGEIAGRAPETIQKPAPFSAPQSAQKGSPTLLFSETDITGLRAQWSSVQVGFVDEPRQAVQQADKLVATVMMRLAEGFANERSSLEKVWDRGGDVSTEDLRQALQRYRAFFDRLLAA